MSMLLIVTYQVITITIVLKTQYNSDKEGLKKKIEDSDNSLVTKTDYKTNMELKTKISKYMVQVRKTAFDRKATETENKMLMILEIQ